VYIVHTSFLDDALYRFNYLLTYLLILIYVDIDKWEYVDAGPDLRGGARGPGPQASHQKGASHQTVQFLFRAHYRVN